MKLSGIGGASDQPAHMLHNAEQAYQKWEVKEVPAGIVGYKLSDRPATPGQKIVPLYVLAGHEHTGGVDFTVIGAFGGDYLLKVEIPALPGVRTTKEFKVTEWGDVCRYFPGNPAVTATKPTLEAGCEVLVMAPTKVLDVYKWDTGNQHSNSIYVNASGEAIELIL